jgi:hypothetical protein
MAVAWAGRLRRQLKSLGWSVPELARRMGKQDDQPFVDRLYKCVQGKVENPRGTLLADIARAVKMPEAELRLGPAGARRAARPADSDERYGDDAVGAISALGRHNIPDGEIPQIASRIGMGTGTDEPTIEIPSGDGSVAAVPVLGTWKIPRNVLQRRLKGAVSALHIVECEGDSMEPRIHDGDFVFIDTSRQVPSPPGIFALNDGFGQTLKRLEIIPNSDPPRVKIIPENQNHSTYERSLEEVRIIGRYLCRLTMD